MKASASIRAEGNGYQVLFEWLDFDGDDCFRDFRIEIVNGTGTERFDFGDCAIRGLRKVVRFFRGRLDNAGGGFRFPDIRSYELARTEAGFTLQIRFEGNDLSRQFRIDNPALTFDDEFLDEYEADRP
jgi:hypothetical protein